jgi:hypothetical protein
VSQRKVNKGGIVKLQIYQNRLLSCKRFFKLTKAGVNFIPDPTDCREKMSHKLEPQFARAAVLKSTLGMLSAYFLFLSFLMFSAENWSERIDYGLYNNGLKSEKNELCDV